MDKINFGKLEGKHNVVNGSTKSLIFDTCILSEPWTLDHGSWLSQQTVSLSKKLQFCILKQEAQSIEEIWPLRVPQTPPGVKKGAFLFNSKYFLVSNLILGIFFLNTHWYILLLCHCSM